MKIYNGFGITPSKNYEAAGYDFYVPNIDDSDSNQVNNFMNALSKSYGDLNYKELLQNIFAWSRVSAGINSENALKNQYNILHLYLAINHTNRLPDINDFCNKYIIFDSTGKVGVKLNVHDTLFINSGIREAIPTGYAGIFFNKSGRGLKGFDIRACVVDEDYTGYVHLSQQYTNSNISDGVFFVGDKIVQQCIIPVLNEQINSVTEDEYMKDMENSNRGDKGFGSSDEVHMAESELTVTAPETKKTTRKTKQAK
jgi:dUTPase